MYMNMHLVPDGQSLYTVWVTLQPEGTPREECCAEEVDVIAPACLTSWRDILRAGVTNDPAATNAETYIRDTYEDGARVVGVVNQSTGGVTYDSFEEDA